MGFATSRYLGLMAAALAGAASTAVPDFGPPPPKRLQTSPAEPILHETRQLRRARERREWKRANRRGPHNGTTFAWPEQ